MYQSSNGFGDRAELDLGHDVSGPHPTVADQRQPRMDLVNIARERAEELARLGLISWLAEDPRVERHERVARDHQCIGLINSECF